MIITNTITKKILENIVQKTFSKFGVFSSSALLDSLKYLGFSYATTAGVSINIEDLKTPDIKKHFIKTANEEIREISQLWQDGFVSDNERFQTIIDSWNTATESLKNKIVDYYENYDPTNNLYIMAFSGARGNMSQVRQLVGMRGLMADQEGKIIDLPIQSNFREGLSAIDYIISSYGARKGIVDTALKTADSGYLTRRLIYLAQDLIIREKNCKTNQGIIVLLDKKTNFKNIIGRTLISTKHFSFPNYSFPVQQIYDITLDEKNLQNFKKSAPILLNIRSSLTCKSNGSICQKCYGWDLAHNKLIALGEAVGIIAAQSIGEPGTQLTMRTFHTGGIFTGELVKQIVSPFSGKLEIPIDLKTIPYRTNHGTFVLKLQQEVTITITNWKGIVKSIFLEIGSFLYIRSSSFIKKNQLIAEYTTQSVVQGGRRLKPILTEYSGEIRFENLINRKISFDSIKKEMKVTEDDGILWIDSGKFFSLPKEIEFLASNKLEKNKPFAKIKLSTPTDGVFISSSSQIFFIKENKKICLRFQDLEKQIQNCFTKIFLLNRNYQYFDKYTIFAYLYIFSAYSGKIYSIRKKNSLYHTTFFLITEADVWKINADQVNDFLFFPHKKMAVRKGEKITTNSRFSHSGIFLKKDGFQMIFQNAMPIFLRRGTILNYNAGDFILKKKIIATLVNSIQQTEDIVQGLPKIEELIEARKPKVKALLSKYPGIVIKNSRFSGSEVVSYGQILKCFLEKPSPKKLSKKEKMGESINTDVFPNTVHSKKRRKKKTDEEKIDTKLIVSLIHNNDYFEENHPIQKYTIPLSSKVICDPGSFIDIGEPLTEGMIDLHELLAIFFRYHSFLDGLTDGIFRSLNKFQILLVHSIQAIYQSQGVNISTQHIEIIVRQMTSKVLIKESGNTPFLPGELVRLSLIHEISISLKHANKKTNYEIPTFNPLLLSATNSALSKDGFLSAAGFQETKRVLTKASIEGSSDWLRGLKECIIIGRLIPAGSAFFNYKNYLDNIYLFQVKKQLTKKL
jgi:hypothetical protein